MRRRPRVLFVIHKYTGFIFAAYLIVVCVSGAVLLLLENAIPEFRDYPSLRVPAGPHKASLDAMLASVESAHPGKRVYHVLESCEPGCSYDFSMQDGGRRLDALVDPYSGRVLETVVWQNTAVGELYALHGSLYAGDAGETINATAGLSLVVLGVTGLWLWPGWRRFRWTAFQVHTTTGVIAAAFLLVWACSAAAQVFWPDPPEPIPSLTGTARAMRLDSLVPRAAAALPGDVTMIYPPDRGVVVVRKRVPGDPDPYGYSYVVVDASTGALVQIYDARRFPFLWKLRTAAYAVHIGSYGGIPLRLVYAIAGCAPAVLFVSAFFMWLRKI
jgi:uncharacterized iron-regulated membrane protein